VILIENPKRESGRLTSHCAMSTPSPPCKTPTGPAQSLTLSDPPMLKNPQM